ncbi:protein-tyrosine phosphatase-like protein [Entophlyctis helioformis]|nr:protein-tyrosine phosphatase-like protein [Entophlyctis helioformis]
MEGILNFRDALAGKTGPSGPLKAGMVFRSAALESGTSKDIDRIVKTLGVKSIIDLRQSAEVKISPGRSVASSFYVEHPNGQPLGVIAERRLYKLDLVKNLRPMILDSVSLFWKIITGILFLIGFRSYSRRLAVQKSVLQRDGLTGLNKLLLEHAPKDIKRFMDICAEEASYPIIVHCSAGKDRTGLTVSLLQMLLGVPKNAIVEDYAKSVALLDAKAGALLVEVGRQGLSPEFALSPPHVMVNTIEFIEKTYGSISNYLESVGVSLAQQDRIRRILLDTNSAKL